MKLVTVRSYSLLTRLFPVLVLLCAYSYLEKEVGSILTHYGAIKTVSEKIGKTGVHIRELPEMKTDFENLVRKKVEIASSLFGAQSEAALYELLLLKAREADVSIVSMSPRPRRPGSGYTELPLSLDVSGSFDEIARFTSLVENVNRLMRVDELVMSKDHDGSVLAAIKLLVYMYTDTASSPSTAKGKLEAPFQKRENYLAELGNVLQVKITPPASTYEPSGKNDPFGATDAVNKGNTATQKPRDTAKQNLGVTLKGILWKETPLAIFETIDGRTFIVKKGEEVNGFMVTAIERTEVTIATPQGNHVLHQYSEK